MPETDLVAVRVLELRPATMRARRWLVPDQPFMQLADTIAESKINAQDGKKLTTEEAAELRDSVQAIIDTNCMTILALAYTELDGQPGFTAGDALIAQFEDVDGSGDPSVGIHERIFRDSNCGITSSCGSGIRRWG